MKAALCRICTSRCNMPWGLAATSKQGEWRIGELDPVVSGHMARPSRTARSRSEASLSAFIIPGSWHRTQVKPPLRDPPLLTSMMRMSASMISRRYGSQGSTRRRARTRPPHGRSGAEAGRTCGAAASSVLCSLPERNARARPRLGAAMARRALSARAPPGPSPHRRP